MSGQTYIRNMLGLLLNIIHERYYEINDERIPFRFKKNTEKQTLRGTRAKRVGIPD